MKYRTFAKKPTVVALSGAVVELHSFGQRDIVCRLLYTRLLPSFRSSSAFCFGMWHGQFMF
jgi:hypothetical protein